jgi:Protein of unknown function with PCYCGC motif
MPKKTSRKGPGLPAPQSARTTPQSARKAFSPLVLGAIIVVVLGFGGLALWRSTSSASPGTTSAVSPSGAATDTQKPAEPDPKVVAKAEAAAKFGPHKQAKLPPIPFQGGYAPPRPHEVVTAAYQFAAEHPEILSYVPCFCGCERAGHTGNSDCFVKSRAPNGDVIDWDEHGVECAVCIDVANRSRQMHSSGASVRDIRAAIDKEFGPLSSTHTPTPHPPGHVQP